jgi:hypothetical protein
MIRQSVVWRLASILRDFAAFVSLSSLSDVGPRRTDAGALIRRPRSAPGL